MQYKNTSGRDLTIPGIGIVKAGETLESESFHNANFSPVQQPKESLDLNDKE